MFGDNPAARLLEILEEGKDFSDHIESKTVWRKILNLKDESDTILLSRLGKIMQLPEQIKSILLQDFPNQTSSTQHWEERVLSAFLNQDINQNWKGFYKYIDDHTIAYLRLNADLLQTKSPTKKIDSSKIIELKKKVSEILEELIDTEIDPEFKIYMIRCLNKLILTIDEYRISGASPILDTVESVYGHAFVDENYRKVLSESEIGSKIITVMSFVADSMTTAIGVPQLSGSISSLLELYNG
ncbi:hypothetical protein MED121_02085 [Marinomonas sp. MED121]|uniref:hypothetical protein n=1 Tax=Marinomonas sp. MED121 TaxID=314277 RepID=UPI0000690B63|nr:hypothetical protein [Marinomonas sp. MED121]EAQ65962.1 hypothetical protein MED121_02085 [Marinomonas sp. MED121]